MTKHTNLYPGQYRISRIQLINWGTFHGYFSIPVARKGFLITGGSGSGKSTLLDAMSAVLVPQNHVKFNAASQQDLGRHNGRNLGLALPGERVIVDVEDLRESIGYVRAVDNRDEAGFTKRFNAAIKRIQNDYSLLSTTETEGRFEVSPVLRQLFDASTVTAIRDEYARLARAEDTEEDTSDD